MSLAHRFQNPPQQGAKLVKLPVQLHSGARHRYHGAVAHIGYPVIEGVRGLHAHPQIRHHDRVVNAAHRVVAMRKPLQAFYRPMVRNRLKQGFLITIKAQVYVMWLVEHRVIRFVVTAIGHYYETPQYAVEWRRRTQQAVPFDILLHECGTHPFLDMELSEYRPP